MNETMNEDFNFFAASKRVKKEEPVQTKSPLDTGLKWMPREEISPAPRTDYKPEIKIETRNEIQTPITRTTPASSHTNNEVENIGTELQKFRKYPQKSYDTFLNKMVTFQDEEFYLIRDLSAEISSARKRSNIPNKGALPRVTENTIIRAALKTLFQKIGNSTLNFSNLQTEEGIEAYFNTLMKD